MGLSTNKTRFISDIISKSIDLSHSANSDVERYLIQNKYDTYQSSFNYLYDLPLSVLFKLDGLKGLLGEQTDLIQKFKSLSTVEPKGFAEQSSKDDDDDDSVCLKTAA